MRRRTDACDVTKRERHTMCDEKTTDQRREERNRKAHQIVDDTLNGIDNGVDAIKGGLRDKGVLDENDRLTERYQSKIDAVKAKGAEVSDAITDAVDDISDEVKKALSGAGVLDDDGNLSDKSKQRIDGMLDAVGGFFDRLSDGISDMREKVRESGNGADADDEAASDTDDNGGVDHESDTMTDDADAGKQCACDGRGSMDDIAQQEEQIRSVLSDIAKKMREGLDTDAAAGANEPADAKQGDEDADTKDGDIKTGPIKIPVE